MSLGIGIVGSGLMSRTYAFGIRELVEGARCVAGRKGIEMALAADRSAAIGEAVRLPLDG